MTVGMPLLKPGEIDWANRHTMAALHIAVASGAVRVLSPSSTASLVE
jgi:gentisate 1,2-dioxygenase